MERKIGEIFEYKGEWYQCIVGNGCKNCAFYERKCYNDNNDPIGDCCAQRRKDNKEVIFKKLEKVGEPMKIHNRLVLKVKADAYMCMRCCFYSKGKCELTMQECEYYDCGEGNKFIEIKQNKEDMEEKGITLDDAIKYCSDAGKHSASIDCKITNYKIRDWLTELKQYKDKERFNSESTEKDLKSFSLEAAKAGKPVCTRDGRKARIICFDAKGKQPIIALFEREKADEVIIQTYNDDGSYYGLGKEDNRDLMMLPEKKEGWVNLYKSSAHSTKEEAMKYRNKCNDYIDTIKIEWEE